MKFDWTKILNEFASQLRFAGRSESTIASYLSDVQLFLDHINRISPADITSGIVSRWDENLVKTRHHNTRRRHRTSVKLLLRFLGFDQISDSINNLPPRTSDPILISPLELTSILHSLDPADPVQARDGAMIAVLATTGIRLSELRRLRMGDIRIASDAKNFVAIVQSAKPQFRTRLINFGDIEKSGDIAKCHFGFWFSKRLLDLGGRNSRKAMSAPVFAPIEDPFSSLSRSAIADSMRRSAAIAARKITAKSPTDHITPHTLRHFFATQATINGMSLIVLRDYMGHSTTATTERYVHLAEKSTGREAREHGPTRGLRAHPTLINAPVADEILILRQTIPAATS